MVRSLDCNPGFITNRVCFGRKDTESSSFWASLSLSVKTQDQMIFKGPDISFYVQQIISEDGSTVPPTSYFFFWIYLIVIINAHILTNALCVYCCLVTKSCLTLLQPHGL